MVSRVRFPSSVAGLALGWAALSLGLFACEPECFDVNDCLVGLPDDQEPFCEVGRCVLRPVPGMGVEVPLDAGDPEVPIDAGASNDAGRPDAGRPDAGTIDAGVADAGRPDAGRPDSGVPDAGVLDAGIPDAGRPDAGIPDASLPLRDGGVFFTMLYDSALESPLDDGGGIRGRVDVNVVGDGGSTWLLRYRLGHDAGADVTEVFFANALAPLWGPLVGDAGLSLTNGSIEVTTAELREVQEGRVYVALPSAGAPDGYLRGQLMVTGETLGASSLIPLSGSTHPGHGAMQMLFKTNNTMRYEATWTEDVVATAAHIHHPSGTTLLSFALLPDAGGAKGVVSVIALASCQTAACYTDVHTADAGVLLRSP